MKAGLVRASLLTFAVCGPDAIAQKQKFGNDPEKHVDFSAVTHVAKDKGIPPFLILYFSGNPVTRAQARRLESVLAAADVPVRAYGKRDTDHSRLNNDLGKPDDPATKELYNFLDPLVDPDQ